MQAQTSAVQVLGYGHYGNDDSPLKYEHGPNAGRLIEYVTVIDPDAESPRRITLDPSINGERANVGELVQLVCRVVQRAEIFNRADGQPFSKAIDKWKVLAFLDGDGKPRKPAAGA